MIRFEEDSARENPRETANWLSALTFWYTIGAFREGGKRDLEESDLTKVLKEDSSSLLGDKISNLWTKELINAKVHNRRPSLTKVVFKTFYKDILLYAWVITFTEMFIKLSQPIFVGLYIRYFNPTNLNNTDPASAPMYFNRFFSHFYMKPTNPIQLSEAYFYATAIFLCSLISFMVMHPYMMAVFHLGMKIRVACCSLIYRKALTMSLSNLGEEKVGNPINLICNDVNRFDLAAIYVHFLWISPMQVLVILYFIYLETGSAAFVGMTVIAAIVPMQVVMGFFVNKFRLQLAIRTDSRLTQMNEIIQSMQVIKMYSWEYAFAYVITALRKEEVRVLRYLCFIKGIIMSFIMFTSRFGIFLTVFYYNWVGNQITAEKVFLVTAYYQVLRSSMTMYFPQGIALVGEAYVTIKRIESYMLATESAVGDPGPLDPRHERKPIIRNYNIEEPEALHEPVGRNETPLVSLNKAIATFKSIVVLSNIDMEIVPTEKPTLLIGPVGSGKSCLLHLILGELELLKGRVHTRGIISYASQEPWLFAGSVRQNILFGQKFQRNRYNEVIQVCALIRDFTLLPYGDKTLIGEHGSSLSGGQKARVNLARAVYKDADIYLLDDPLSAVDIQVGQQLFHECIIKYLKEKIVILVTHQLQFLKFAGDVYVLHGGIIEAQGTHNQFLNKDKSSEHIDLNIEPDDDVIDDDENKSLAPSPAKGSKAQVDVILRRLSVTSDRSMTVISKETNVKYPVAVGEIRTYGSVSFAIYKEYFRAAGPYILTFFTMFLFLAAQFAASGGDYFLGYWIDTEEVNFLSGSSNTSKRDQCVKIYFVIIFLTIIVAIVRSFVFFITCLRASTRLHDRMFRCLTRAVMKFFVDNSSGRILNRFSKDLGAADEVLSYCMIDTIQLLLNLVGAIIVVSVIEPRLIVPISFLCLVIYFVRRSYIKTSRSVKRLEGITKSPVLSHLNASIQGLTTIRSNHAEQILVREFDKLQDVHSSCFFLFLSTSRAFGVAVDFICCLFTGMVTFCFVILADQYTGSQVGLAITQCMGLSGLIQWGMRQSAELENQMTSVERMLEFTRIEEEPDLESSDSTRPPDDWPLQGKIEFIYLNLRYNIMDEPVLKNLSLLIEPGEKIGIVGRTGAGKSSLIGALFRLNYYDGSIIIDGIDVRQMGLHDLRRRISIIPQEPIIFYGTLRYNLDPFREYDDLDIYNALLDVEISFVVTEGIACLDHIMTEGGSNLSVGQRQLVCLARAILRNNRILVLDEATANVDHKTDAFIQRTIRTKFADCTVLTIAHRLHTIMDSDRVLVMDAGTAVEFNHPHLLLQEKYGHFSGMVNRTGPKMAKTLREFAKKNFETRRGSW